MPRSTQNSVCSVARALDFLGDRWALLIIRDVLFGIRRFDDFASHLGIARTVLTDRLKRLVEAGVLEQVPLKLDGRRHGYVLSRMGEDLVPALIALMQWGDRWLQSPETVPIQVVERATGHEIARVDLRSPTGAVLGIRDLDWVRGPGAADPAIAPLIAAYESQRSTEPPPTPQPAAKSARNVSSRRQRR